MCFWFDHVLKISQQPQICPNLRERIKLLEAWLSGDKHKSHWFCPKKENKTKEKKKKIQKFLNSKPQKYFLELCNFWYLLKDFFLRFFVWSETPYKSDTKISSKFRNAPHSIQPTKGLTLWFFALLPTEHWTTTPSSSWKAGRHVRLMDI